MILVSPAGFHTDLHVFILKYYRLVKAGDELGLKLSLLTNETTYIKHHLAIQAFIVFQLLLFTTKDLQGLIDYVIMFSVVWLDGSLSGGQLACLSRRDHQIVP
jgi:hypothetical protein